MRLFKKRCIKSILRLHFEPNTNLFIGCFNHLMTVSVDPIPIPHLKIPFRFLQYEIVYDAVRRLLNSRTSNISTCTIDCAGGLFNINMAITSYVEQIMNRIREDCPTIKFRVDE